MLLVAGVRCSFRGKDAGNPDSRNYRGDRGRRIGASSAARGLRPYFAKPSYAVARSIEGTSSQSSSSR
jgi:hypothetical protein